MRRLLLAPLLVLAAPAAAQPAEVVIRAEQVAPGVAVLFGQGGNIGVSHGTDGTVLIDDQFAPLTPRIVAAVAALPAAPVRFLINTHWHGDHTGGNENLGKAGVVILAQDHVRERMSTEQDTRFGKIPPSPAAALPVITYPGGIKLHVNGDTIRTLHVPHAHTDGDSIVFWEKANVVHMGDTFMHAIGFPFIDLGSGGSARGLQAAIAKVLGLIDDTTVVVPGHGGLARRADLLAFHTMLTDVIGAVEKARATGRTEAEVVALKPAAKYDIYPSGFIKADEFVATIYKSLASPPAHHGDGSEHSHDGGKPHRR